MSVTVADLMRLPSMRDAKILGGKTALNRIVSVMTVLEYANPSVAHDILHGNEFYRSEMLITGFINNPNDVNLQVECIRQYAEEGDVGIVLYYVGVFLPRVDQKLIDVADEMNFALICMPKNDIHQRYSDLIYEAMELIVKDQMKNVSFVSEIIDRVSGLLPNQRTMDTVLKMLSDKIGASLILTDRDGRVVNQINWPGKSRKLPVDLTQIAWAKVSEDAEEYRVEGQIYWMARRVIQSQNSERMEIIVIKEKERPEPESLLQIVETVQISMSIWNEKHGEVSARQLLRAILHDEPVKMKRLAEILQVDVEQLTELWILHDIEQKTGQSQEKLWREMENALKEEERIVISDYYESVYVIVTSCPKQEENFVMNVIQDYMRENPGQMIITHCSRLRGTTDIRKVYCACREYDMDTARIFLRRSVFTEHDLDFAEECNWLMEQGEQEIQKLLAPISAIDEMNDPELTDTLLVYLLDTNMNIKQTGELLYVHKNTVKYRIQKITELTGIQMGRMPEMISLFRAAAVYRLIKKRQ